MYFVIAGFSVRSVISGLVLLLFAGAFLLTELRSQRPRQSFYRLALASGLLLIMLIEVSWHGNWLLAGITWLGMTVLALIVTVHFERSEPLN